jgi:hypothetical protein
MRLVASTWMLIALAAGGCSASGKMLAFSPSSSSSPASPSSPASSSGEPAGSGGGATSAATGGEGDATRPVPARDSWAAGIDPTVPRDGKFHWPRPDDGRGVLSDGLAGGPVGFGQCDDPGPNDDPPVPTAPADPWAAVDRGVPAALPVVNRRTRGAGVAGRTEVTTCDAAHDHCVRECTWFARADGQAGRQFDTLAVHRLPDGQFAAIKGMSKDFTEGYLAYRTVPATRRLLADGRRVLVRAAVPANEADALTTWREGVVYGLDLTAGTLQIKGGPEVYPLAAVRLVVLVSKAGGPVEIVDGLTAKDIVVSPAETF